MTKITKVYEIGNVEDLKEYLKTEKNVDYLQLLDLTSPVNHDFSHNLRSTPMFEYLLENIPDLWVTVKDREKEVYLAQKVINVVNHYARDEYYRKFVEKLGKDISNYDKSKHKDMWTEVLLACSPAIFSSYTLADEIERSIGKKETNDVFLNHIHKLSISHRYQVERAIETTPKEEVMKIFKKHIENEDFYSVSYIQSKLKLTKEDVQNIQINNKPLETFLMDKKEEYTVAITGEPIKKGSHKEIDKIFRKNLMKNKTEHNYRLNYFDLDRVMDALGMPNTEEILATQKKKKVKAQM